MRPATITRRLSAVSGLPVLAVAGDRGEARRPQPVPQLGEAEHAHRVEDPAVTCRRAGRPGLQATYPVHAAVLLRLGRYGCHVWG